MKKIIITLSVLFGLLVSSQVHADHHLVYISQFIYLDDSSCAVELTISADDQDGFTTTDGIALDGETIALFEADTVNAINDAVGHNDDGDEILFASPSFMDAIEALNTDDDTITSDGEFDDTICATFTADSELSFFIDGDTTIDIMDLSGADVPSAIFSSLIGSYTKTSVSSDVTFVSSEDEDLTVSNNTGDIYIAAEAAETTGATDTDTDTDTATTSSSSCSLQNKASGGDGFVLTAMLLLGGLIITRIAKAVVV